MTAAVAGARVSTTGLIGPVAFWACAALLAMSPLVRGGNRFVALVPIELVALVLLGALAFRAPAVTSRMFYGVLALACAPLAVALVQLVPLFPGPAWAALPGHAPYADVLQLVGGADDWRALSVAPRATAASLLAGIPLAAALLAGYLSSDEQLRWLVKVVIAVALVQMVIGAIQLGGGALMYGANSAAPVGTFGNRNHFGSYCAVAMCCWLWLAWGLHRGAASAPPEAVWERREVRLAVFALLLVALLMSRSRAAIVFGLGCAMLAIALGQRHASDAEGWRRWLPGTAMVLLVVLVMLVGVDALTDRFMNEDLGDAASHRVDLARSAWHAAVAFFPFGSGWGTFDLVYPVFQPHYITKFVNHAHMDFLELLVEGGVLFLAFGALFVAMAARRARALWRALGPRHLGSRDAHAAAYCGIALLVLLLHSLVDFPLRIPALAILGSFLAGAYLRPLPSHKAPPP